ncbi:hypothetical protein METHPM2_1530005 [Pseudomonas sp. PM2]
MGRGNTQYAKKARTQKLTQAKPGSFRTISYKAYVANGLSPICQPARLARNARYIHANSMQITGR